MAKKIPFSADKLHDEFLQCSLCMDQYKEPKVLPCQHTFCLSCLQQYVATKEFHMVIPCPLCKALVNIPFNNVENLKSNFLIVSLIHFVDDFRKASSQQPVSQNSSEDSKSISSAQQCHACSENLEKFSSFCEACVLWLCASCSRAHKVIPSTASHVLKSDEEIKEICEAMAEAATNEVINRQQDSNDKYEALLSEIRNIPEKLEPLRRKIEAFGQEAKLVVEKKVQDIFDKIEEFQRKKQEELDRKLRILKNKKDALVIIEEQLKTIQLSDSGFTNKQCLHSVESSLASLPDISDYSVTPEASSYLTFRTLEEDLNELRSLKLGFVHEIQNPKPTVVLRDHTLKVHKVASLVEREYITALAINRIADKFVVANNESVLIFKPDSKLPKPFLSPFTEPNVRKPWGICYSEEDSYVYITNGGKNEGDGTVAVYSHDGTFKLLLAGGLTLPRGIAIHNNFVFVCDQIDKCVYIFNKIGRILKVIKKTEGGINLFDGPMFVSINKQGRFAISDSCSSVKIFDQDCTLIYTYVSCLHDSEFWDVHVLQDGTVVVCDWKNGLHKISPDFKNNGIVKIENSTLKEPAALTALNNGNSIYIGTCGGEVFSAI